MTAPKPQLDTQDTPDWTLILLWSIASCKRSELSAFWKRRRAYFFGLQRHDLLRHVVMSLLFANMRLLILLSYDQHCMIISTTTTHARWARFHLFTFRPIHCFQRDTRLSSIIITTSGFLRRKWGTKSERKDDGGRWMLLLDFLAVSLVIG